MRNTGRELSFTLRSRTSLPSTLDILGPILRQLNEAATSGKGHYLRRGLAAVSPPLVLLDTNALMMPFQFSLDLEDELVRLLGEYRAAVPSSVIRELEGLSSGHATARAALQFATRFPVIDVEGVGDEALLALAQAEEAAVLTNDRDLRRRLRKAHLPVIYLRERSRLEAVGLPLG